MDRNPPSRRHRSAVRLRVSFQSRPSVHRVIPSRMDVPADGDGVIPSRPVCGGRGTQWGGGGECVLEAGVT